MAITGLAATIASSVAVTAATAATAATVAKKKKDKEAGDERGDALKAQRATKRLRAAELASAEAKGKTLGSTGGLGRVSLLGG